MSYRERMEDVADRIGVDFGSTTAMRSLEIAELLIDDMNTSIPNDDDRDDLINIVADGVGVFLRLKHSKSRMSAMKSVSGVAHAAADPSLQPMQQVSIPITDFPITVPGQKTVQLKNATCIDVQQFIEMIGQHIKGYERSMQFCINALGLWEGQDERLTLSQLVASGAVTMRDIEIAIEPDAASA